MKENPIIKKTSQAITDSTDQVLNQLKNGLSKIGDLATYTKSKFVNYVKEVFQVLPLLKKLDFELID